ncbi:MAG TPA: dihydropteroate synthase, partial [Polyangiaceae bacterium]
YDGGRYATPEDARSQVDRLIEAGADILDIGGESSRPGAQHVSAREQIARLTPAVTHALSRGALVSIDTTDPTVADHMLQAGAHLVNDVSCLADPELARVCARHSATLLLMHARGPMSRMAGFSEYPEHGYSDVVSEVLAEWRAARDRAIEMGMPRERIWLDPGLGFGKNARHSFALLNALPKLAAEGVPVVVGPSRKSFIRLVDEVPPEQRLGGTIAAAVLSVELGARVLRVHDVRDIHQALVVSRAIRQVPEASRA